MSAEDEMRPRTREEVQREIDEEIEEQRANWLAMTPAQRLAALDELRDAYCEHECCEWDCKRATEPPLGHPVTGSADHRHRRPHRSKRS